MFRTLDVKKRINRNCMSKKEVPTMKKMTSRERVIAALNHQPTDRCPIDLGSSGQTGMNASTMYRFRKALGLEERPIKLIEPLQMLGEVDEDLRRAVHGDIVGLWNRGNMMGFSQDEWKPYTMYDGTPCLIGSGFEYDLNENGDTLVYSCGDRNANYAFMMPKGGSFFDNVDHFAEEFDWDLDEEDLTPVEDFKDDFQVMTDEDARYIEDTCRKLYEETDCAIMGNLGGFGIGDAAFVPGPAVKYPRGIRKVADWMMATAMFPGYVDAVFSYQEEVMLKNLEIYKQAVGDRIQSICISGTDFGTQRGLFMSKDTFRSLYKPHYKVINDWVHNNTNWKTYYHTCGCVNELLDDFVEMGLDCLNPVQFSAMEPAGMTPERLKKEYGDKLIFWGGGVDTQRVLPFGTPEEVIAQVKERVEALNKNGGFIFNTIHNVVANVPAENLIAMYETVLGEKII